MFMGTCPRVIFLILSLALGISLEFIQGALSYRDMSFADGVTNTLGVFSGVVLFYALYKQVCWIIRKLRLNRIFLDN